MGGRLLRRWLHRPLRNRDLGCRHHAVATLIDGGADGDLRERRALGDLERILTRIALRSARPRDFSTLRDGLALLPGIRATLAPLIPRGWPNWPPQWANTTPWPPCWPAIAPQPPLKLSDGGVIADGLRCRTGRAAPAQHACRPVPDRPGNARTRAQRHPHLKVGYNRVHGYYIEISKGQADKAPVHYTRRQTLTNAERYITEELKAFEDKVLSARARCRARSCCTKACWTRSTPSWSRSSTAPPP
jgi:DNA mismatch repair protein MutS